MGECAQMKKIPLSGGGHFIIDDSDYEIVRHFKWNQRKSDTQPGTSLAIGGRKAVNIGITALLMGRRDGMVVDHIDHDPRNNTRSNLRWATLSQNNANRRKQKSASHSRYKGVCRYRASKPWVARLMLNGKRKFLGYFHTEEDAAREYDRAALAAFGEFAVLNFPEASRG